MPAVAVKSDCGQKKSLIPRPIFKKVQKPTRTSNVNQHQTQKSNRNHHQLQCRENKLAKCKNVNNKENINASTSAINRSRIQRNASVKSNQFRTTKLEHINPNVKKTFVEQQIDSGLVAFEPDPTALRSILINKGITSEQVNGRFSNARPSLYGNSSRLSSKKLSLEQITLNLAKVIARQANSSSVNNDVAQTSIATTKKTPVRLSMYGRRNSLLKMTKTPNHSHQNRIVFGDKSSSSQQNSSEFVPPPSTTKKPFLLAIDEAELERDSLSPRPQRAVEFRRDSGAFNTYTRPAADDEKQKHFVHTPKPKRRFDDERKSFSEILNVSPTCDAMLIDIEPPIRTPLLMKTVSMRVKHEQNTKTKSPYCLRKSSPKFEYDAENDSPDEISASISPIRNIVDDSKRDFRQRLVVKDEIFDRLCDAEVENLLKNAAKRLKMSSISTNFFTLRMNEPVAATLTNGDETCFLPIVEE